MKTLKFLASVILFMGVARADIIDASKCQNWMRLFELKEKRANSTNPDEILSLQRQIKRLTDKFDEQADVSIVNRINPFIEGSAPLSMGQLWDALGNHAWRSGFPESVFNVVRLRVTTIEALNNSDPNVVEAVGFEGEPILQFLVIGLAYGHLPLAPNPTLKNTDRDKAAGRVLAAKKLLSETSSDGVRRIGAVPPNLHDGKTELSSRPIQFQFAHRLLHHLAFDVVGKSLSTVQNELRTMENDRYFDNFGELIVEYLGKHERAYPSIYDRVTLRAYFRVIR